jgi:hypothetical protein
MEGGEESRGGRGDYPRKELDVLLVLELVGAAEDSHILFITSSLSIMS